MATVNEKELQAKLDLEKWVASEKAGHDVCGEFDYCVKCDKTQENPCAKASAAYAKPAKKPAAKKEVAATTEKAAKPAAKKPAAKKPAAKK